MPDREGDRPLMVGLGKIVNTHGIRGEVRMFPYNPSTEAIVAGVEIGLRRGEKRQTATVRAARHHKNLLLLTLVGVESMSAAEELLGAEVELPADSLPTPGENEAYHFQLIGLDVVTTGGEPVGVVEEMFSTPANDVCVVRHAGREFLIPYIDQIIRSVDLEGRRLVIEPIPGLLDE